MKNYSPSIILENFTIKGAYPYEEFRDVIVMQVIKELGEKKKIKSERASVNSSKI